MIKNSRVPEILEETSRIFDEQQMKMRTLHQIMSQWMLILLVKRYQYFIFDNVYTTYVILEKQLFSAEIQAAVGNNYAEMQSAFNNFKQEKASARPKRQAILADMYQ